MQSAMLCLTPSLILFFCHIQILLAVDLTVVDESEGTDVVEACIAKISAAEIFTKNDHQLLRRIAFVEFLDGTDPNTYMNNGGIWQLSESKFLQTKTSNLSILQGISTIFGITWGSTVWSDLRKPFYSALAARLYLGIQIGSDKFPFSTNIDGQSEFWKEKYTSSTKMKEDYADGAKKLNKEESMYKILVIYNMHVCIWQKLSVQLHQANFYYHFSSSSL